MSQFIANAALSRINGSELLVTKGYAEHVFSDIRQLAGLNLNHEQQQNQQRASLTELAGQYAVPELDRNKPFVFYNGAAIIPVHGTLINRFNWSWSFVTGYNFIRAQMNAALDDEDVEKIIFDVNSYGGEAAGCFELCDEIRAARERKPMLAVVDSNACSAAYAIASSPQRMVVTPSGQAGSIGVIAVHVEFSKFYENNGIAFTVIAEGEHKADGNPYEPLPEGVEADIRSSVSKRRGEFVELVVKNRGLDSQAVLDTESRSYRADEALELRLIDAVQTPAEAVADFLAETGSDEPDEVDEDEHMTQTAEQAAAVAAAKQEGAKAERARASSILGCEEAKGKQKLAAHLALNTEVDLETAKTILANAQSEEKEPAPKKAADPKPKEDDEGGEGDGEGEDDGEDDGEEAKGGKGKQKAKGQEPAPQAAKKTFFDAMDFGGTPNVGDDGNDGNKDQRSRGARAADLAFGPRRKEGESRTAH